MPKMFEREVPPVTIESVPDREKPGARQERRKEIVHEKIVQYADAVVECMRWIDSVTIDTPREEVFRRLDEMVKGVPDSDRNTMGYVQRWKDGRRAAWEKAHAYHGDTEGVTQYFNSVCSEIPTAPLRKDEIVSIRFEPFCVEIALTNTAFNARQAFSGDGKGDIRGCSFGSLGLTFVIEDWRGITKSRRINDHEIGHQLLGGAPIHPWVKPGARLVEMMGWIFAARGGDSGRKLSHDEKLSLKACMRYALEGLHEEFLAEFYAILQSPYPLHVSPRYWSTAEMHAFHFEGIAREGRGTLSLIDEDYAELMFRAGQRVQRQFQRAKASMIEAFVAAQNMPYSDARRFVVATAVVMPIRSYHHIWDILTAKYGVDVVESAKAQLLTDGLPEFPSESLKKP